MSLHTQKDILITFICAKFQWTAFWRYRVWYFYFFTMTVQVNLRWPVNSLKFILTHRSRNHASNLKENNILTKKSKVIIRSLFQKILNIIYFITLKSSLWAYTYFRDPWQFGFLLQGYHWIMSFDVDPDQLAHARHLV